MKKLLALLIIAGMIGTTVIGCGSATSKPATPADKKTDDKKTDDKKPG